MSETSSNDVRENEWAKARIRPYLLGRLSDAEVERFTTDVALLDDLVDEVDEAEKELIAEYLDGLLPRADREDFARCYVNGDEENQIALQVQKVLHAERLRNRTLKSSTEPRVVPIRRGGLPTWFATAAAAVIVAITAGFGYYQWRLNTNLRAQIAAQGLQSRSPQKEQPAGQQQFVGIVLDASPSSGAEVRVREQPALVTWQPVPDYRSQYRIRIRGANGAEVTSPPLTPKDYSVSYSIDNPSVLPLPWQVFVLSTGQPGENVLRQYALVGR